MSDLSIIPLQDWFETQLSQDWNGAVGTVYVLATPSYTPTTTNTYIVVNPWKTNMQIAEITDYDSIAKTLTVSSISFEKGLGITSSQQTHSTGSKVIISDNYQYWEDIQTAINSKLDDTGGTMTGLLQFSGTTHWGLKVNSLTTVQRDALTPANGLIIYNSTAWEFQIYQGGTWSTVASGSTQPNASTTVLGKIKTDVTPAGDPVALITDNPKYDALAGTSGTPSTSNKYVTNDDTTGTWAIVRGGLWAAGFFGNGVDGNVTIASWTTTLTRDMFYNNLTLQTGAILESAWFMIFVAGTLTQEGTGYIRNNWGNGGNWGTGWNGSNGVNGTAGTAGAAGTAAPGGTLPAGLAWVAGGAGGAGSNLAGSNAAAGTNGIAATNALGSNWVTGTLAGGGGWAASAPGGTGWAYGSLASVTASKSKIADYNAARNFACFLSGTLTQFWNNAGNASAGGGGGWAGNNNGTGGDGRWGGGGGGGGSGWNGWAVVVFAKTIITASNTLLQAKWGAGGNGGTGGNGGGGSTQFGVWGGGGGSKGLGGNGGIVVLVYKTLSSGSIVTDVTAGAAGTNGSGGTGASPGSNGTAATSTTTTEVAGQAITITL